MNKFSQISSRILSKLRDVEKVSLGSQLPFYMGFSLRQIMKQGDGSSVFLIFTKINEKIHYTWRFLEKHYERFIFIAYTYRYFQGSNYYF